MAGTFEVGSIVAKLGIDDKAWVKDAQDVVRKAKKIGKNVKEALSSKAKINKTQLAKDAKQIVGTAVRIGRNVEQALFVKTKIDKSQWTKDTERIVSAAKKIGRDIKFALVPKKAIEIEIIKSRPVIKTLNKISRAVRKFSGIVRMQLSRAFRITFSAKPILLGLRLIQRGIIRLRTVIFGLQGAMAALGIGLTAIGLIKRARDIEELEAAFVNLSRSIGSISGVFLEKLRKALKGTVSDMELMKVANNAILLGVAKNEDEFAELTTLAKRLGAAVGRNATDAVNDLTVGIGRQSRMILDNLGLIVKVEAATEAYALKLGRHVDTLTDAERRQAFMNATLDSARAKVKELGPAIDTLNDAWGFFSAAISNTATIVAQAFIGGGPFARIGKWLTESKKEILAFSTFASEVVTNILKQVEKLLSSLFSGGGVAGFVLGIKDVIYQGIIIVSKILFTSLSVMMDKLGLVLLALVGNILVSIATEILRFIPKLFTKAAIVIDEWIFTLLGKIPWLGSWLGLDDPKELSRVLNNLDYIGDAINDKIDTFFDISQESTTEKVRQTFDLLTEELGPALDKAATEIQAFIKDTAKTGDSEAGKGMDKILATIKKATKRLALRREDPILGINALSIQKEIQPLATELNKIINLRKQLIQDFPDLIDVKKVKSTGEAIKKVVKELIIANKTFADFAAAPEEDKKEFGQQFIIGIVRAQSKLKKLTRDIQEFAEEKRIAASMEWLGMEKGAEADRFLDLLFKFRKSMKELEEQTKKTSTGFSNFLDLKEAFKTAKAPDYIKAEEFQKVLAPFKQKQVALKVEVETIGLKEAAKELKIFDLAFKEIKDRLSPEDLDRLEKARKALADLLAQKDAAKQADVAIKKLKAIDKEIRNLSQAAQESTIGAFGVKILQLNDSLEELKRGLSTDYIRAFEYRFEKLVQALGEAEIEKVNARLRELDLQLKQTGSSAAAIEIEKLERGFQQFAEALEQSGLATEKSNDLLRRMRDRISELQGKTAFVDLNTALESMREQTERAQHAFEQMSRTPLQQAQADITREYDRLIESATEATNVLIAQRIAAGADSAEIEKLKGTLRAFRSSAEKEKGKELEFEGKRELKLQAERSAQVISQSLEKNLGGAIISAVQNGESVFKSGARIWAGIFEDAMNDAMKRLSVGIQGFLTGIFSDMGTGGAIAGIASGLLGLAGVLMSKLESDSSSSIDDFDSQINSSEAVRGVVAGPTNVAISKIGDSLKSAMRTSELLLSEILQTLQSGGGGGGGEFSNNDSLSLSTSTPS